MPWYGFRIPAFHLWIPNPFCVGMYEYNAFMRDTATNLEKSDNTIFKLFKTSPLIPNIKSVKIITIITQILSSTFYVVYYYKTYVIVYSIWSPLSLYCPVRWCFKPKMFHLSHYVTIVLFLKKEIYFYFFQMQFVLF